MLSWPMALYAKSLVNLLFKAFMKTLNALKEIKRENWNTCMDSKYASASNMDLNCKTLFVAIWQWHHSDPEVAEQSHSKSCILFTFVHEIIHTHYKKATIKQHFTKSIFILF